MELLESAHDARLTDELIERVKALVPFVRANAREGEKLRRIPDKVMRVLEEARLFDALVPKRFGGQGLGMRALCEAGRILATGDASTAWVASFFMEHNWMACYYPISFQEELYAERSFIKMGGALAATGRAVRVPGGYRLSGKFKYSSGAMNADWLVGGGILDDDGEPIPYGFFIPASDATVHDAWFFSGMAATSSTEVEVNDIFVPENRGIPLSQLHSTGEHPGAVHEESLMRYPILPALYAMMMAMALGCGQRVIEIGRERLHTSAPWGLKRIDRESSRVRWLKARQQIRLSELLYKDVLGQVIRKGEAQEQWSLEETAQVEFDRVTVAHNCLKAVRLMADGCGSSVFSLDDELQRYLRDMQVIANHIGLDWDLAADRDSRYLLGLGRNATDPHAAIEEHAKKKKAEQSDPAPVPARS